MDETGVEPVTFCLQGRRATNYATRPSCLRLITCHISSRILEDFTSKVIRHSHFYFMVYGKLFNCILLEHHHLFDNLVSHVYFLHTIR